MKAAHSLAVAVLALLWLVDLPARANLIPADDPRFGSHSLTVDPSTGLVWLDLKVTAGLSYDQALADTQLGGIFSGYRFATADEIVGLYRSAGIPGLGPYPASGPIAPALVSFISMIGPTLFQNGAPGIDCITGTISPEFPGMHERSYAVLVDDNRTPVYYVTYGGVATRDDLSDPSIGMWLVASVPEAADPSIYLLAAGGLIGFSWLQRRNGENAVRYWE